MESKVATQLLQDDSKITVKSETPEESGNSCDDGDDGLRVPSQNDIDLCMDCEEFKSEPQDFYGGEDTVCLHDGKKASDTDLPSVQSDARLSTLPLGRADVHETTRRTVVVKQAAVRSLPNLSVVWAAHGRQHHHHQHKRQQQQSGKHDQQQQHHHQQSNDDNSETDTETPVECMSKIGQANYWPHAAVLLLLAEHANKCDLFNNPAMKKADVWSLVAKAMKEDGYSFTADACAKKWNNLKNRYRIIRKAHSRKGAGRITWEYYNLLDDQLFDDPSCIVPQKTVGSLSGITVNTNRPRAQCQYVALPSPSSSVSPKSSTSGAASSESPPPDSPQATPHRTPPVNKVVKRERTSESPPPDSLRATHQPPPPIKKKVKRRKVAGDEPPQWFLDHLRKQNEILEKLVQHMSERNKILQSLADAIK